MSGLSNLKSLRLHFNPETNYVKGLSLLKNVYEIELMNINKSYLNDLCELKSLKKLKFEPIYVQMYSFPQQFYELDNLEELTFCLGTIGNVSNKIVGLKSLKYLKLLKLLRTNHVPPEIGNLIKLEKLIIAGTCLKQIPKEISKLKNLRTLVIWGNQLEHFPREFNQLDNLTFINIGRNNF